MSGGSWDYVYGRVGEAAERLMRACLTPRQEAEELRGMIAALRADLVELEARLP